MDTDDVLGLRRVTIDPRLDLGQAADHPRLTDG
jgi:hypothetical protein